MRNDAERDLVNRAFEATEIGVSLGAFARTQGLSYRELKDILERNGVKIAKRVCLIRLPKAA